MEYPDISPSLTTTVKIKEGLMIPHVPKLVFWWYRLQESPALNQAQYNDGKNIKTIYTFHPASLQQWKQKKDLWYPMSPKLVFWWYRLQESPALNQAHYNDGKNIKKILQCPMFPKLVFWMKWIAKVQQTLFRLTKYMHELGNDLGYSMSLFLIFSEYLMVECPYISPSLTTAVKTEKRFTIPHVDFLKNIDCWKFLH